MDHRQGALTVRVVLVTVVLAGSLARPGLIWDLFMRSDTARRSLARLKLEPGERIPGLKVE